jgi:uncharacterized membrane protein YraQ (UPF0718 family)
MIEFLTSWMVETWDIVLDSGTFLLAGFACAGLIYLLMPTEKVVGHLGTPGLGAVVKASLVGIPLPLCSCSVIPVASSIRQRGASRGATASFLVSTPETGVDSIAISYALLGPALAVIRPLAALVTALTAGWLINLAERGAGSACRPESGEPGNGPAGTDSCHPVSEEQAGNPVSGAACCCPHATEPMKPSLTDRIADGLRYSFVGMFKDLSIYLVAGFLLAGLVSALVPADFFEKTIGSGWLAIGLMLLVGLPLYVCATSSTPVAAALIAKGISPGAALVFLLVGPATNAATMVVVGKDLGRKSLVVYLLTIAVVAMLFALGTDALPGNWLTVGTIGHDAHQHGAGILAWICAVVFTLLVLNGLRLRYRKPAEGGENHATD